MTLFWIFHIFPNLHNRRQIFATDYQTTANTTKNKNIKAKQHKAEKENTHWDK